MRYLGKACGKIDSQQSTAMFCSFLLSADPWLLHPLRGIGYQFFSGIGSSISEWATVGVAICVYVSHHNCHEHRCAKLGWQVDTNGHVVCKRHHPDHPSRGWFKFPDRNHPNHAVALRKVNKMSNFLVVQGCPCNPNIAPYFALLAREAHATIDSIYRGDDAAVILNHHSKHSQGQLYRAWERGEGAKFGIEGKPNPPGQSTHELRSDAVAYSGPVGRVLEWWQQGIDVNNSDVNRMIEAARSHGWDLFQPYKAGVEFHHLNFRRRPVPRRMARLAIIRLRLTLPRH